MTTRSIVLVHGAFHGGWCWDRVVDRLATFGVHAVAPDLPYTSWKEDVDHVRQTIRGVGGPVLLVGHSLGGGLVCAAGDEPEVDRLGFISAMVTGPEETIRDRMTAAGVAEELRDGSNPELALGMSAIDEGYVVIDPAVAADVFYSDCTRDDAAFAASRLRPISGSSLTGRPEVAPWRSKPASYLFCTADHALADEVQQAYADGLTGRRDVLQSSHSPFWSRPDAVAGTLADWATMPSSSSQ